MSCVRGDVHELRAPRGTRGHEQSGARLAVVLQSDDFPLSTLLVAPTSTSARPRIVRPAINVNGLHTQVLVEQIAAIAPERLGALIGRLTRTELDDVSKAMRLVLGLD